MFLNYVKCVYYADEVWCSHGVRPNPQWIVLAFDFNDDTKVKSENFNHKKKI